MSSDQAAVTYEVVFRDRVAASRGYRAEVIDSAHDSLFVAEERCREIILKELRARQSPDMDALSCVQDYVKCASIPYIKPSDGGKKVFFDELPRQWLAEELAKDWPALLKRIAAVPPEIPRSWFRWLHHSYLFRNRARVNIELKSEWESVAHVIAQDPSRLDAALLAQIEAHSWEIGRCALRPLAEAAWERLTLKARGALLAGISDVTQFLNLEFMDYHALAAVDEAVRSEAAEVERWLLVRLPETDLSGESTFEIACNAIWKGSEEMLAAALRQGAEHLHAVIQRMEPFGRHAESMNEKFAKSYDRLSHRLIDMVLEASVLRGNVAGARIAMEAGADPNLRIWALDRNSNEDFTALTHAISEDRTELVDLLLKAGADPAKGNGIKALFLAIQQQNGELADRLLAAGVAFDQGDMPYFLESSEPDDNVTEEYCMFFNCFRKDIEQAQRLGKELPLVHATAVAWVYRGGGQGGRYSTLISNFLYDDDVARLRQFVSKGMPLHLTLPDLSIALSCGAYDCLTWMMQQWGTPGRFMLGVRRELPEFGTQRRAWMVRADSRRIGVIGDFETHGLEPLDLPDGGRLWADLSGVAGQDIETGPVWSRKTQVELRRRSMGVVLRAVSHTWTPVPAPQNDHQLRDLVPVVKESDGIFLNTGLSLGKVWWQDYSKEVKGRVEAWIEGEPWKRMRPKIIEQAARNVHAMV